MGVQRGRRQCLRQRRAANGYVPVWKFLQASLCPEKTAIQGFSSLDTAKLRRLPLLLPLTPIAGTSPPDSTSSVPPTLPADTKG